MIMKCVVSWFFLCTIYAIRKAGSADHAFAVVHSPNSKPNIKSHQVSTYDTMVLAVALSYLQVGGRTPTVL